MTRLFFFEDIYKNILQKNDEIYQFHKQFLYNCIIYYKSEFIEY